MADQDEGHDPNPPGTPGQPKWIVRRIRIFQAHRKQRRTENYHKSAGDRAASKIAWAAVGTAVLTAVLAGAAISQYFIFSKQLSVMRGQLDEAQRGNFVMNRGWASPRSLNISPVAWNRPLTLSVVLENSGKSPATDIVHKFDGQTLDVPPTVQVTADWIKSQIPENDSCENGKIIEGTKVVYPSTVYGNKDTIEIFSNDIAMTTELAAGRKTFYMQGCILYKTAGGTGRSRYCFFAIPPRDATGLWDYGSCPTGNDAE